MLLNDLISFLKLTHKYNQTLRGIYVTGQDRKETDVEHSFQLALFAWYICDYHKLKLDLGKVIKYALVHDLAEVFTGDKHIFDARGRRNKEHQEQKAFAKIQKMFPKWKGYKEAVKAYIQLVDEEARFVNALDKLLPVMNIYLDKGKTWKEEDTSYQTIYENKIKKVALHPQVEKIYLLLDKKLKTQKVKLFGKL